MDRVPKTIHDIPKTFILRSSVTIFDNIATNGLQLGEVAEIEAQMFSFAQEFNRRTAVEFSTKPAILPNCCYASAPFFEFSLLF